MLELTTKYIIKREPTTLFRTFPPRNSEMSKISIPGNFLNNLHTIITKIIAKILTYIQFINVALLVVFKSVLGKDKTV